MRISDWSSDVCSSDLQLYGLGLIGGFCHLYIGQEAVAVGLQSVLSDKDSVITGYRDHGHMLLCGIPPKDVMAALTARQPGLSKGKGGSMHMFSFAHKFYGGPSSEVRHVGTRVCSTVNVWM